MPIDDRLVWENVAHIHQGILCSSQKGRVRVICRDMDESGEHHSQQTDTRTENETPHILTHRQVRKNENTWTQGREYYTLGSIEGIRGGTVVGGRWKEIAWGEMPNVGEGEEKSKAHCHVGTYTTVLHALLMYPKTYNPIKNKKKRKCL